jgi:hypothetical protein
MEPDYKADTIKGKQRAYRVVINNPEEGIADIDFLEELKVRENDKIIYQKETGHATDTFTDPAEVFDLINPITGENLGQVTYQDYYVMTYSVYRHVAAKRDAVPTPVTI